MRSERGAVLLSSFIVMAALTAITVSFLALQSVQMKGAGSDAVSHQAIWLAEAGMQKAIWNLKTPTGSGGQGEDWTTAGTTENLGAGGYTMVVARYDFALAANGSSASDSPAQTDSTVGPAKAVDSDDATYWESLNAPKNNDPQDILITFPYPVTINKVRFLAPSENTRPRDYEWSVSSDGTIYTTVVTSNNNSAVDVTDTFTAQTNVSFLRLRTTQDGQGGARVVRVATLETIGSKITATGTASGFNRKVEQTVVADDASPQNQVAYNEIDWNEVVPA